MRDDHESDTKKLVPFCISDKVTLFVMGNQLLFTAMCQSSIQTQIGNPKEIIFTSASAVQVMGADRTLCQCTNVPYTDHRWMEEICGWLAALHLAGGNILPQVSISALEGFNIKQCDIGEKQECWLFFGDI